MEFPRCYTIIKRSAASEKIKNDTLFQETLRRLCHVLEHLPWSESVIHLNKWSDCMRISGYSHKERFEAIRGAVMRFEAMKEMVSDGTMKSLNRDKLEISKSKADKGGNNSNTWFLKGKTSKVMKCQANPDGKLADMLKTALNPIGAKERVQVVEEGGVPLTAGLRKKDPFFLGSCRFGDPNCII